MPAIGAGYAPRRGYPRRAMKFLRAYGFPMIAIAVPTSIAALYFGIVAAPIFVSESKFVVRFSSPPAANAFTSLLQSNGIARSQDDTFSVFDYLQSRDALRDLETQMPIRTVFSSSAADRLARFPRLWDSDTFEGLYRYFSARTEVIHNSTTGITTLRTTAFDPGDAYQMNQSLLRSASNLLNRMNDRALADAVTFSQREVDAAEQRLILAQNTITTFRNNELMIDPSRNSTIMLEMIGRLSTELAITRARRTEAQASAPDSTSLPTMTSRISALEDEIQRQSGKMVGNDKSVAPRIAEYETLTLSRELASKSLIAATNALDAARADARRQQLYLEPVVKPNRPDEAELPYRIKMIAVTFLVSCIGSLIVWLLVATAREHSQG